MERLQYRVKYFALTIGVTAIIIRFHQTDVEWCTGDMLQCGGRNTE